MLTTILKYIWPYLQRDLSRRAAEAAAGYLQTRREQRLAQPVIDTPPEDSPPPVSFLSSNTFWYGLSGLLLGAAFSLIAAFILKKDE
jgi:hypothetical protein